MINFFDGEDHYTFETREEALAWLSSQRSRMVIWCVNLGYDLPNLFGDKISCMEIIYIESRVISAKISGTQVYFRDTLNHWKISVKGMGVKIGLEKLEDDLFDGREVTREALIIRCHRDTEITWKFVKGMGEHYASIGCKLKATIGSTSLDFFHDRYGVRETKRVFSKQDIEFMLKGYFGGRVEIFRTRPIEGKIQYYDFNSLYPSVMAENLYPSLAGSKWTRAPDLNQEGICHATVRVGSDCDIPYLPFRDDRGRLLFPTGTFQGHWTYFELRRARDLGYEILDLHRALEFSEGKTRPFERFVRDLYQARLEAKRAGDTLLADAYKLILNNLYGKYAQGNEFISLIPFDEDKLCHLDQVYGDMILKRVIGEYPTHTNVIWSAYTTAYGRDKLYCGLTAAKNSGGLLLYCDTDSIIFENQKRIFENSDELGKLGHVGDYDYAHFKLPKLYRLDRRSDETHVYRAKGVPQKHAAEFFDHGRAEFRRPNKLREALLAQKRLADARRAGRNVEALERKLIPNYWNTTQKEVRTEYDKRRVEKDGSTRPIEIRPQ